MVPLESQICTIVLWLVIIKFCQMTLYPYLKPAFEKLAYGLAYPTGILVLTLISWYLGFVHLPVQLVLIPFAILGGYALWKKMYCKEEIKENTKWDLIFFGAFLAMLCVRYYRPGITPNMENYMEAAFLGSIMNNPVVTPADPWFSGGTLSIYYYLGHWMMGVLGILCGGTSTVVFNLMLPTVFALSVVSACAIGTLLLKWHWWIPSLVFVLPNTAFFWNLFVHGPTIMIGEYSVYGVVPRLSFEYPLFSYLLADPHAHLLGSFNQLFCFCMLTIMITKWAKLNLQGKYLLVLLIALSLGTMAAVHSWDVLLYAGIYLFVGCTVWYTQENHDIRKIIPFILVPIAALLTYGPYLLETFSESASISGVKLVTEQTPFIPYLGVYLIFFTVIIIYGYPALRKYPWLIIVPVILALLGYPTVGLPLFCILLLIAKREILPETIFGICGMVMILLMEIIYLDDATGSRFNFVYKYCFDVWLILGPTMFIILGKWIEKYITLPKISGKYLLISAGIVLILLAALPGIAGINTQYPMGTLDGSAWMETLHPADAKGINYLSRNIASGEIVVEAPGTGLRDPSNGGRVSTMTGISTILGMISHEKHWRSGTNADIDQRVIDIQKIYEDPDQTLTLMDKYGAVYLFVGESEHERYNVSLPSSGIIEVFSADGVSIYRRSD